MTINKNIKDGIFFFVLGIVLGIYCINGYNNSFNHDISQSPYLFPMLIAVFFIILSLSLIYQGVRHTVPIDTSKYEQYNFKNLIFFLILSFVYYIFLTIHPLPYITFGFIKFSLTVSNFEIATLIYVLILMYYMGVRNIKLLVLVPLITPIFLSITFRTMLNVLLP